MPDPIVDPSNPDVRPALPWQWTGFVSALLVFLEQVTPDLLAIPNPPRWVTVVVAAIPFVVRFARILITKEPVSFRRVA